MEGEERFRVKQVQSQTTLKSTSPTVSHSFDTASYDANTASNFVAMIEELKLFSEFLTRLKLSIHFVGCLVRLSSGSFISRLVSKNIKVKIYEMNTYEKTVDLCGYVVRARVLAPRMHGSWFKSRSIHGRLFPSFCVVLSCVGRGPTTL